MDQREKDCYETLAGILGDAIERGDMSTISSIVDPNDSNRELIAAIKTFSDMNPNRTEFCSWKKCQDMWEGKGGSFSVQCKGFDGVKYGLIEFVEEVKKQTHCKFCKRPLVVDFGEKNDSDK